MAESNISFADNAAIKGRESDYAILDVISTPILESWKLSLFSYEWLTPDGGIRDPEDLPLAQKEKREWVEKAIQSGSPLERPVLGIGLMDNIEIGASKAVFLTLAALGQESISVHVPKSHLDEFQSYC